MNTAQDYYKFHKKNSTQVTQGRNNSQVQLSRIEGVVSPISAKGGGPSIQAALQQPYTLKPPPSLQRIHSAKAQSKGGGHHSASNFSTVDVEPRGLHKPSNLPLSRKSPAPQYQTVDVDEQMPTSSGQFNMKHPSGRFGDEGQMQQTLTFRKNKQLLNPDDAQSAYAKKRQQQ